MIEGWLIKQGGKVKSWKKRYFVLKPPILTYSQKPGKPPNGTIDLTQAQSIEAESDSKKENLFKIVIPNLRTYRFQAETKAGYDFWMNALLNAHNQIKKSTTSNSNINIQQFDSSIKLSLDDFELIKVLGRGSYGKVTLVKCKYNNQLYAMKTMSKKKLELLEQVQSTIQERNVLVKTNHPFLVSAYYAFQTPEKIFLVLDYMCGGDMFTRIRDENRFSEESVKLYAAEIALGLGHLHKLGYVYRDLKLENILFDSQGHIKITDFGYAKGNLLNADSTTSTFCGTTEYLAPEIILQQAYTKVVDWWSLGVLIYEMLVGMPPFFDENPQKTYRYIVNQEPSFPSNVSPLVKDLIQKLLIKDPSKRLGNGEDDVEAIKQHPFFQDIKWDDVLQKKIEPQWKPELTSDIDTSNFDPTFTNEKVSISFENNTICTFTQNQFENFTMTKTYLNE